MSLIDIFAWIVLLILVASGIAIFFIAGSLPGHIAKSGAHPLTRRKPTAGAVPPRIVMNSRRLIASAEA
jgi:hypothetical protein